VSFHQTKLCAFFQIISNIFHYFSHLNMYIHLYIHYGGFVSRNIMLS
jgi:hypothetical protein